MNKKYEYFKSEFELRLNSYIKENTLIAEAMNYSLLNGGKRIRPVLYLLFKDIFASVTEADYTFALSIEMIHTYSLIHDDLPAMDNDDYRRGKLTSHKVYGDAVAILAGDGLLNLAYENLFNLLKSNPNYIDCAKLLANYSSYTGMIYGQSLDLYFENKNATIKDVEEIILNKTSKLIALPIICGSDFMLEKTAFKIGKVFQIKDDILDIEGSKEKLGKSIGKDEKYGKNTYVSIVGLKKSKEYLIKLKDEIIHELDDFKPKKDFTVVKEIIEFVINRDY